MNLDFQSLPLSADLLAVIAELGFTSLTPIQAASIPVLLEGKDLIGQSKTGSGKTAAFALPMLQNLDPERRDLKGLVLCPTRELCAQVAREIRRLGRRHKGLQVLELAGGTALRPQAHALWRGAHLAVGTPGRVLDHLEKRTLDLRGVETLVLDEADRMLDMGFEAEMEAILAATPPERQTVFFSATFPKTFEAMSSRYQRDPVRVTVESAPEDTRQIRQVLVVADPADKDAALAWVLAAHPHESALIFANMKVTVAQVERTLTKAGVSAAALHGDLEQYDRDRVLARFRNASTRVLVATDVAARGLDVKDLDLVVNYDLPPQPEIYVHRIGRTGRAGKTGLTVSIATTREEARVAQLEKLTGVVMERVEVGELAQETPTEAPVIARDARMDTIQIAGGRKEKVRPGDILGALTGEAGGLNATDVGKIEIHDHFSYVAVSRAVSRAAVRAINDGKLKGRKFAARLVE